MRTYHSFTRISFSGDEAVGDVDTPRTAVEDWVNLGEEGVLYYLEDRRLVGVVNWNVWDGIPAARALLAEPVGRRLYGASVADQSRRSRLAIWCNHRLQRPACPLTSLFRGYQQFG